MSDLSRQIVDGVIGALTGLPATGANVSDSPEYPADPAQLPCLRVFDPDELYEVATMPVPRTYERALQLQVQALAMVNSGLSAALDQVCLEVKHALAMPALAAAVPGISSITLSRRSKTVDGSGERPLGKAVLYYEIRFQTREDAQNVIL